MVVVVLYLGVRLRMQQVDIEDITVSYHPLFMYIYISAKLLGLF